MIYTGDCLDLMKQLPTHSIDSCVTDPPYGLSKEPDITEVLSKWMNGEPYDHGHGGFMGKQWDSFVPHPDVWKELYRVLKPGAYALVFAGTRTQDLMTIALRMAGFEVRDVIEWLYFSGFPKSMDVGKAFDKREGAEREVIAEGPTVKRLIPGATQDKTGSWIKDDGRTFAHTVTAPATELAKQWDGWGTALKPAHEPIIVVRKPISGTVADNVEKYGTGGINVDGCRIRRGENDRFEYGVDGDEPSKPAKHVYGEYGPRGAYTPNEAGRFPANIVTVEDDGFWSVYCNVTPQDVSKKASKRDRNSDWAGQEIELEPKEMSTHNSETRDMSNPKNAMGAGERARIERGDSAQIPQKNNHPTVKPSDLMQWLVRLVTPPGGTVIDPFTGSGSTLVAAKREGFDYIGIEREPEYVGIAQTRTNGGLLA